MFRLVDTQERVRLVRDAAVALGYAHSRGVVHRDVKPGNLLVDDAMRVRIVDFGLARPPATAERLTLTGEMLGTPTHMAPEQLTGQKTGHSPGTDVWALGVILYEALSDRTPYDAASVVELMAQVLGGHVTPLRQGVPDVDRALEAVVQKAMQLDPEDRYADAGALAAALDAARAGGTSASARASLKLAVRVSLALVAVLAAVAALALSDPVVGEPASSIPITAPPPTAVEKPGLERASRPRARRSGSSASRSGCGERPTGPTEAARSGSGDASASSAPPRSWRPPTWRGRSKRSASWTTPTCWSSASRSSGRSGRWTTGAACNESPS